MVTNLSVQERMSSLTIAELTGKPHNDVMKAIRSMESAWTKVNGGNFSLISYTDSMNRKKPCYELTKTECLYIATKFNDEARAKLVLRWEELETEKAQPKQLSQAQLLLQSAQMLVDLENEQKALAQKMSSVESKLKSWEDERKEATEALLVTPYLAEDATPELSKAQVLRQNIRRMVNDYANSTNIKQHDVWHDIYAKLYYQFGKSINSYKKSPADKSKLDIAERVGILPQIHSIISSMVLALRK